MPRFAFALPGRSKKHAAPQAAPPQQQQQQQFSKAHKVLGSTYISIDASHKSRDDATTTQSAAPTSHASGTATAGVRTGRTAADYEPRDWDDESGVLPRHIRIDHPSDDDDLYDLDDLDIDDSDRSRVLREQASSSTIKSWYDKTKQPLSVTQQTSASAMAKGLPPKAQRLLDVENSHAASIKNRRKPSRLDLSRLKSDPRPPAIPGGWEGPVLGNSYVTHSPAAVTPKTPSSIGSRYRQKLQKQPTKENLRRQQQQQQQHTEAASVSPQQTSPSSADRLSPRRPPNMTELPNLYKHYEQTSFQLIMDQDLAAAAGEAQNNEPLLEQELDDTTFDYRRRESAALDHQHHNQHRHQNHHQTRQQKTPQTPDDELPSPLGNHPTTPIQGPSPPRPQIVHLPSLAGKQEQQQLSPTDCSASISSRHTRTSKASKRTEKSFQTADFIDKSVLMLSSDSEDDDEGRVYTELSVPAKRPALASSSMSSRPTSEALDGISIHSTAGRSVSSSAVSGRAAEDAANRQSSRTVRRTSTAPAGHLTIPSRLSTTSTQATAPSTTDSNWGNTSTFQSSSTTPSIMSRASGSSSVGTAARSTHGGADGYTYEEARIVEARPTQQQAQAAAAAGGRHGGGRDGCTWASDWENNQYDTVVRQSRALIPPGDLASPPATAEDFPPVPGRETIAFYLENSSSSSSSLRPLSGEAEAESATSSSAMSEGHLMGLTRQEQNLITALRQRRESMRKAGGSRRPEVVPEGKPGRGHQSKESQASQATITEESLNFSFPVPPKTRGHVPRRSSSAFPSMITIPALSSSFSKNGAKSAGTDSSTMFVVSPPPSTPHHHQQHARHPSNSSSHRFSSGRKGARMSEHEQMLLYLDHPGGPALAIKEGMMSPDTETFGVEAGASGFSWSRESLSPPQQQHPRRQSSLRRQRSNIETTPTTATSFLLSRDLSPIRGRQGSAATFAAAVILEDSAPPFPPPTRQLPAPPTPKSRTPEPPAEDEGVPRPDSPISAMPSVTGVPEKRRTQMARLSAFGPPNPNTPVAWLGED